MSRFVAPVFVAVLAAIVAVNFAWARKAPQRVAGASSGGRDIFQEMPHGPDKFTQGSVFYEWHFDSGAVPSRQRWTEHDLTAQEATYFHVDGSDCNGYDAPVPISGMRSMWCGQWPTASEPWCGWLTLPGYGNNWDQSLVSTVDVSSVEYAIMWDSEPGYDFTYVEWYDAGTGTWVPDPAVNSGAGAYTSIGGPQTETSTAASAGVTGPTKVRFHFQSDGAWSDRDGLWDTNGGVSVDDLRLDGGAPEDFEGEDCLAQASDDGKWTGDVATPFGLHSGLVHGSQVVQEDCTKNSTHLWEFYDDSWMTNYACGGWPAQRAMPYGNTDGLYMHNEIWSPWLEVPGWDTSGSFALRFMVYRDLRLDNLQFYTWKIRGKKNEEGACPEDWNGPGVVYYGDHEDWLSSTFCIYPFIPFDSDSFQVAIGALDMYPGWGGLYGWGACHSHAPLIDDVYITAPYKLLWYVRHVDLFQDNFPDDPDWPVTGASRADIALDILPSRSPAMLPGDSVVVRAADTFGVASDPQTNGPAVYLFVKVTDRFGDPVEGKNGWAIESPDILRSSENTAPWGRRFKYLGEAGNPSAPADLPPGWSQYQMDYVYTPNGTLVPNLYCGDLMDLAAGPYNRHANENQQENVGVFTPGDVVWYFFGFHTYHPYRPWGFLCRSQKGQGDDVFLKNYCVDATENPYEFSILPDAGRLPGDDGDILFVDDADDRVDLLGDPSQMGFDWAFKALGLTDRVDRFDVLGPSSCAGNSLAARVKNVFTQLIGYPYGDVEIYQKVLWNSSELSVGLMGDGGAPNGGWSTEKSDDFGLCYTFLDHHPDNPGWAYWGDDVVRDWNGLTGSGALSVKSKFMNHTFTADDQRMTTGLMTPRVFAVTPNPPAGYLDAAESFYAYGGCPARNDFDVPGQAGLSRVAHKYNDATSGPNASLSQATPNSAATQARFFLAGFGFDAIADDDLAPPADYVIHLSEILLWFQNTVTPIGIEPVAFSNRLENNYPNPFNPATTIRYSIAETGRVSLRIYNAAGQLVRTLVDEEMAPRAEGFSANWDGTNNAGGPVASGVYFYRLTAKDFSQTKKMVLLK